MKKLSSIFLYLLSVHTYGQNITLNSLGSITNVLNESSGIIYINPNRLYTHNDSGGNNEIYEMDNSGNLIRTIIINNATNIDWEDITKDNLNNLYIGDFGNNNNDRTDLRIYKIPSPQSFMGDTISAETISFNYPDQTAFPPIPTKRNFDAEGLIWYNDSIYIFTKNRTVPFNGYCKMYKIPASPGNYTAQICDSVFLCNSSQSDCWVTSAAISPNNAHLALLNHNKIWWFSCFNGDNFFKEAKITITLNNYTQKEGITFKNTHDIFVTDELSTIDNSGGKLYEADMVNFTLLPYINIIQDSIICDNCSFSADSVAGTVSWSNGTFGPTITPTYTGWYLATATSINNCMMQDSVYISYLQGLKPMINHKINLLIEHTNQHEIRGKILNSNEINYLVTLHDLTGKEMATLTINSSEKNIPFVLKANLKNGLYMLSIVSKQQQNTYKIAITHD
ncbi:MAG TPA: T9SS type A sorting domain-containing protein [Bacteroidia bacterium]|nr:T9SS type A sorting domain-containing protein [Bacteroidia bacterium]